MRTFGVPVSFMDSCRVSSECLRGMLLETCSGDVLASVDGVLSGHPSVMLTRPVLWEGLERKFPTIFKKAFLLIISLSNAIVCCLVEFCGLIHMSFP